MRQKKSTGDGVDTSRQHKPASQEAGKSRPHGKQGGATSTRSPRKRQTQNTTTESQTAPRHIGEIMTRAVVFIHPDDSVQQAAKKMKSLDVGPLPVCEGDKLVGIVTDRDITVRAAAEGLDPQAARVREIMSSGVISCFEDQDVEEAGRLMRDKQVRRLVVLNRDNRLTGIVSLGDLALQTGDDQWSGKVLHEVSQPAPSQA